MKKIIVMFLLVTTCVYAVETPHKETNEMDLKTISVTVNNIKIERGGQLIVFVFSRQGFPKKHEQALMKVAIPVDGNEMRMNIQVPVNHEFALKILHDENMDGEVTKNWTGFIPRDGLGFSNGARMSFGPPGFDSASVRYSDALAPTIKLQYY